jgi:hypothetical protein
VPIEDVKYFGLSETGVETMVGGSAHAKSPAGAKALLGFLSSPEAAATYRQLGMQPAR